MQEPRPVANDLLLEYSLSPIPGQDQPAPQTRSTTKSPPPSTSTATSPRRSKDKDNDSTKSKKKSATSPRKHRPRSNSKYKETEAENSSGSSTDTKRNDRTQQHRHHYEDESSSTSSEDSQGRSRPVSSSQFEGLLPPSSPELSRNGYTDVLPLVPESEVLDALVDSSSDESSSSDTGDEADALALITGKGSARSSQERVLITRRRQSTSGIPRKKAGSHVASSTPTHSKGESGATKYNKGDRDGGRSITVSDPTAVAELLSGEIRTRAPTAREVMDMHDFSESEFTFKEINMDELRLDPSPIGSGAFGVVYKASWRGAKVAVKKLLLNNLSEKDIVEFRREAAYMILLGGHPNVVKFVGVVSQPPNFCLVSPFFANGSVRDYLKRNPNVPWSVLVGFARDAAAGVLHLHCEHIIHRDLAARNFLVDDNLTVKLSDFGMSRSLELTGSGVFGQTNSSLGPVRFMAPESILNRNYSPKSDAYSFGVFLYELVAREEPYQDTPLLTAAIGVSKTMCYIEAELRKVAKGELRPTIPKDTPEAFKQLMQSCWKQYPDERPDFYEILSTLEEYLEMLKAEKHQEAKQRKRQQKRERKVNKVLERHSPSNSAQTVAGSIIVRTSGELPDKSGVNLATEAVVPSVIFTDVVAYYIDNEKNFKELVKKMREFRSGLDVKQRRYHLKKYRDCFVGSEAVDWMLSNTRVRTREEALQLGDCLIRKRVFRHVVEKKKRFLDGYFFYRFCEKPRLVIIGGGFGGSTVAIKLETKFEVTLIDTKDHFEFYPSFPVMAVTPSHATKIRSKHTNYLTTAQIVVCEGGAKQVRMKDVLLADGRVIPFDYLCLCTGSFYDLYTKLGGESAGSTSGEESGGSTEGEKEKCNDKDKGKRGRSKSETGAKSKSAFNTQEQQKGVSEEYASLIRSRVVDVKNASALLEAYGKLKTSNHVVVIGGGTVGIEVATEIACKFPDTTVTIVHSGVKFMPRLGSNVDKAIRQHLGTVPNLVLVTGERVVNVDQTYVYTDKGTKIKADIIYGCVGFSPRTDYLRDIFPQCLTEKNEVKVNAYLQMEGYENIFALGDIACIYRPMYGFAEEDEGSEEGTSSREESDSSIQRENSDSGLSSSDVSISEPAATDASTPKKRLVRKSSTTGTPPPSGLAQSGAGSSSGSGRTLTVDGESGHRRSFTLFGKRPTSSEEMPLYGQEEKLAQNAEKHAAIVIKNLKQLRSGGKLRSYKPRQRVMVISLGPKKSLMVRGNYTWQGPVISKIKSLVEFKEMRNFQSK